MRIARTGPLAGFILIALAAAGIADSSVWRPLKIDGYTVRWSKPLDEQGRQTLTWRVVGQGATHFSDATNCRSIAAPDKLLANSGISDAAFRHELKAAFDMWEIAAGLRFVEAAGEARADIIIGAQGEPEGRAFADVAFERNGDKAERPIVRSLVCLNPAVRWKVGFDGNLDIYDLRYTFAHEIGHAIGLDHPKQRGSLMWFRYDESLRGLQVGDVEGAIALYGTLPTARSAAGRAYSGGSD